MRALLVGAVAAATWAVIIWGIFLIPASSWGVHTQECKEQPSAVATEKPSPFVWVI